MSRNWQGMVPGVHDDPNNYREVWGNPNEDPMYEAEYGDEISAQGSASGSLSLGGLAGTASGASSFAPAATPSPRGGSWGFVDKLRQRFAAAARPTAPAARPAAAPAAAVHPAAMALWAHHHKQRSASARREMLLEPNKGSATKIERYTFSVSTDVITGTASSFSASNSPDVCFRPQRITANLAQPGLVIIDGIRVANVNVTVGGVFDAFDFNADGVGQSLDMPTLSPSNKLTVSGGYTGVAVPGLTPPAPFKVVFSAKGPAKIVG